MEDPGFPRESSAEMPPFVQLSEVPLLRKWLQTLPTFIALLGLFPKSISPPLLPSRSSQEEVTTLLNGTEADVLMEAGFNSP